MQFKTLFTLCLLLAISHFCHGQSKLSGIVTNENHIGLPGVILHIEQSQYTITSEKSGNFAFYKLKDGLIKVQCRLLGYNDTIIQVNMAGETTFNIQLSTKPFLTDEVVVKSTRTGSLSAMANQTLSKEEIEKLNTGQDLPYLLQLLPSAVVTSDAGNGIGYTGIRIRGSDATRVNVTINGIPLNDAESQGVYWVNLPDFASSTQNIEVTRGAGVSTNGSGAFGGTINILSQQLSDTAFLQTSNAFGKFNTLKNNISFGTGLLKNHFSMEGRLSKLVSDGYMDRGKSDLKSFYLSTAYRDNKNLIRLNIFSGKEITYQSWNGIPESRLNDDVKGMMDYIDRNGLSEEEANNLLTSGRTYNYYTYKNQNDNYQQDHYQLLASRNIGKSWLANIGLHATKGKGYYEEYKSNQELASYNISTASSADSLITHSDLVRRRWLDNWFYGITWSVNGNITEKLKLNIGGAANRYDGKHFGEVIWARNAGSAELTDKYYENKATKDDINSYIKADIQLSKQINIYGDLQFRHVNYSFLGPNEFGSFFQQEVKHNFFNPKAGITYQPNTNIQIYASASVAQKEPSRSDYIETSNFSRPNPEKMIDYETGVKWSGRTISASVNLYYMDYTDQLILTGKVNDVGSYTRSNIKESYRMGIELEAAVQVHKKLVLQGNFTLSENKIPTFTEFVDAYDVNFDYLGQEKIKYNKTTIAFSPSMIASGALHYSPTINSEISFITKYVSQQYLDNTESKESEIPAYFVGDIRLSYNIVKPNVPRIKFNILLNNIFSSLYVSNGYTYGYIYDNSRIRENFYYPQAEFNLMGQIMLTF
ncbi:MAG: TonB-dependent receptor [Bacteroidetes bacterium]|nr:TonB-dependent receptor [Bacteroidota bacterium]